MQNNPNGRSRRGSKIRIIRAIRCGKTLPKLKKLIIEVDGEYHFTEVQQHEDELRSKRLNDMGFYILRFTNNDVLNNTNETILTIQKKLQTI